MMLLFQYISSVQIILIPLDCTQPFSVPLSLSLSVLDGAFASEEYN